MIYLDKIDERIIYYKDSQNFGFGFSFDLIKDEEHIFSQNKELIDDLSEKGYNITPLSRMLNLPEDITLYRLFSYYFTGKIETDFDMLKAIFNGFFSSRSLCYCLKIGNTFCWFEYIEDKFRKLGTLQFSHKMSKHSVGHFIKQLNYAIALTGINLNSIKFLVWSKSDLNFYFREYIKYAIYLSDLFINVKGLGGLSCLDTYKLLSNELFLNPTLTADKFVNALNDSFRQLSFNMDFECNDYFYKDYSKMTCNSLDYTNSDIFIILDCEGKKGLDGSLNNGLDKLGGLICCKFNNNVINIEQFNCDEFLIEDTLKIVFQKYRQLSRNKKIIDIVVYGTSDEKMFLNSYNNYKRMKLNFIDGKPYILNYLRDNNISVDGKLSLTNIAKELGVAPIYPKHNPVNDARTLFNILAKIIGNYNRAFII